MPRYFFDLTDCDGQRLDDTGLDLPDVEAAQQVLEMSLPRISAEKAVGAGNRMTLIMSVRDACDQYVIEATLDWTITTRRIEPSDRRLKMIAR